MQLRAVISHLCLSAAVLGGCIGTAGKPDSDSQTTKDLCVPSGETLDGTGTENSLAAASFTCAGPKTDSDDDCKLLSFEAPTLPTDATNFCFAFSDAESSGVLERGSSYEREAPAVSETPITVTTLFRDSNGTDVALTSYDISTTDQLTDSDVPPPVIYATLYSRTGCSTDSMSIRQIGTCYTLGANMKVEYIDASGASESVSTPSSGTPIMSKINPAIQVGWEVSISRPGDGQIVVTKIYADGTEGKLCGTLSCKTSITPTEIALSPC